MKFKLVHNVIVYNVGMVALGESFHLCRLKNNENSKPQREKKIVSLTVEGRICASLKFSLLWHTENRKRPDARKHFLYARSPWAPVYAYLMALTDIDLLNMKNKQTNKQKNMQL